MPDLSCNRYLDAPLAGLYARTALPIIFVMGMNGLLTSRMRDGTSRVIAPGFGEMAGTAYAPNGDLILADAGRGALLRVTPNGGSETLHGGLSYPNGVAVDPDGIVFVADQNTGAV